jgi:hypothetical protein
VQDKYSGGKLPFPKHMQVRHVTAGMP